ncbi:hypothetical protein PVAND_008002 [Polypedilum vanderplanki]|uniref:Uncharacterized protein n=1 Tax=Polypedilum vanderplanki TaxID=319348 RepID=A0A9J6C8Q4_POLVA|nr:hypothetical protein PVAND_008002 [Polypedilum vanderplanki]
MKQCIFLIISFNFIHALSYIQEIRNEILNYQIQSRISVDESFNLVYNSLAHILISEFPKLNKLNWLWNKECEKFPYTSLNEQEIRRLQNICEDVGRFLRNIPNEIEKLLEDLHRGILKNSFAEEVLKLIFENTNKIVNDEIEQIVTQNSNCTNELIKNYNNTLNEVVQRIININTIFADTLSIKLKSIQRYFIRLYNDIELTIGKIQKCAKSDIIDVIGCMEPTLKYHCQMSVFGSRRCGSIYTYMTHFKEVNIKVSRVIESYREKFAVINEEAQNAEKKLEASLDSCTN